MPEGLAVAVALYGVGYSAGQAVGIALATGLVEPLGAWPASSPCRWRQPLLPWGLAFAAGAMIFVVSNEIIPETHRRDHQNQATFGLMIGFVLMMTLDVVLG